MSGDFYSVVRRRRSVRKFTGKSVPDEVIVRALQAALIAPNSSNLQPWEFYWFSRKSEDWKKLVKFCLFQDTAKSAEHLVVVVSRIDHWRRNRDALLAQMQAKGKVPLRVRWYYQKLIPFVYRQAPFGLMALVRWVVMEFRALLMPSFRGPKTRAGLFEVVTKSTALACENFMLAITAEGYGSCPMEGFDEVRVKRMLGLGSSSHVVMILAVGDPDPEGIWGEQHRLGFDQVVFRR